EPLGGRLGAAARGAGEPQARELEEVAAVEDHAVIHGSASVVTCEAVHDDRVLAVRPVLALAMTADAPAHLERRILIDDRHRLDRPVALLAGEPRPDVALVVELDVLGQGVDRDPG